MQEGAGHWPRASPWVFDSLLAAAAALSMSLLASGLPADRLPRGMVVLGCALGLLHTLPIAARRRFPLAVLATSVASGLAFAAIGLPPFLLGPAIVVPVYTVAAYCDRRVALAGLAAAWLLGSFVADPRAYATQLEERTAELEQARENQARRAVAEERLRLARELHDVVAHSMSVIAVQSGGGFRVAARLPFAADPR